jgi:hypothetical protein
MDPAAELFIVGSVIGGVFGLAGSLSERLVRAGASIAAITMAYVIVEGGILALAKKVQGMLDGAFAEPALCLGIIFGFLLAFDGDSATSG